MRADRIPSSQEIHELYFERAYDLLLRGDYEGFFRFFGEGLEILKPYSTPIRNWRWLRSYCNQNRIQLPDTSERVWKHEKSHYDVARKWRVGAQPKLALLRDGEYPSYLHLSMRDLRRRCPDVHSLIRFFYEVLSAPRKLRLDYSEENQLAERFYRALKK